MVKIRHKSFETVFSTKLSTWALKLNKKYRFLFPQRLLMLKICKNIWLERSASERALNEGSPSVVFSLKFCHTSPLQSLGCVRRNMRKKPIFLAIFCHFSWNKKQIHAQKTFFSESTSCKTTAPHNFNADQVNGSGTYFSVPHWVASSEKS